MYLRQEIKNMNIKRPQLTKNLKPDVFLNFYWLKQELIDFCKKHKIYTSGAKADLTKRIKSFLEKGIVENVVKNKSYKNRDSDKDIRLDTKVINYKNDLKTRFFFKKHIGNHFHFTAHLMKFIKNKHETGKEITYEDLIKEWKDEYKRKQNPDYKTKIGKTFEYNQFIRDFFTNNKGKKLSDAIRAWKKIKSEPGSNKYLPK